MASLLLFKFDHSAEHRLTLHQFAALPKPFDLIETQLDGWRWGRQELINPMFRIALWPAMSISEAQQFMSPLLSEVNADLVATTYPQYRGFYLDLSDVPGFTEWWEDDSRRWSILSIPDDKLLVAAKKERAPISIPSGELL